MPEPYIAVENCLTEDAKELLLQNTLKINPQLEGAKVADILDMYYNADAMIDLSEPFWERHSDHSVREVPAIYVSLALIATALMLNHPKELDTMATLTIQLLARRAADEDGVTGHHAVEDSVASAGVPNGPGDGQTGLSG